MYSDMILNRNDSYNRNYLSQRYLIIEIYPLNLWNIIYAWT